MERQAGLFRRAIARRWSVRSLQQKGILISAIGSRKRRVRSYINTPCRTTRARSRRFFEAASYNPTETRASRMRLSTDLTPRAGSHDSESTDARLKSMDRRPGEPQHANLVTRSGSRRLRIPPFSDPARMCSPDHRFRTLGSPGLLKGTLPAHANSSKTGIFATHSQLRPRELHRMTLEWCSGLADILPPTSCCSRNRRKCMKKLVGVFVVMMTFGMSLTA